MSAAAATAADSPASDTGAAPAAAAADAAAADASPASVADAAAASLRALLAVQGRRAQAYARLHAGFRKLLAAGGGRPSAAEEASFAALLSEDLAPEFSTLSSRARELGAALASSGFAEEAALVRTVQAGERDKLRLTLTLQQLRRPHAARAFSWQRGGEGGEGGAAGGARADDAGVGGPLDPAEVAARRARGCGCGHGQRHGAHEHGAEKDQGATEAGAAGGGAAKADDDEAAGGAAKADDDDDDDDEAAAARLEAAVEAAAPEPTEEEWRGAVVEATAELDAAIGRINEALEEAVQLLEE